MLSITIKIEVFKTSESDKRKNYTTLKQFNITCFIQALCAINVHKLSAINVHKLVKNVKKLIDAKLNRAKNTALVT